MAFPIALALLGYGIYNKKQKEAELQEALSDTTKTPAQRIDALIQANPMMAADPRIQAMQAGIAKNDELVTAAEETRKKALWDETWKNVPAVSQEAFIRANPEEAAKYAPERTKAIMEKDKNAADLKLWTDKAGITDKFGDENRIQDTAATMAEQANSAALQRQTSLIQFNRENDPAYLQQKKDEALALEAAKQTQKYNTERQLTSEADKRESQALTSGMENYMTLYEDSRTRAEAGLRTNDDLSKLQSLHTQLRNDWAREQTPGTSEPNESLYERFDAIIPPPTRNTAFEDTSTLTGKETVRIRKEGFRSVKGRAE